MPERLTPTQRAVQERGQTMYGEGLPAGDDLFGEIEQAITLTDEGMMLLDFEANAAGILIPPDAPDEQIQRLQSALFAVWDRMSLYIGDLLVSLDNREYGETKVIASQFRRNPDTLYKWKSVCKAVTIFLRRKVYTAVPAPKKPLTMKHYEIVMALSEEKQEQLLIEALRHGWSSARLLKEAGLVRYPIPRRYDDFDLAHPEYAKRMRKIQRKVKEGRYDEIDLGELSLSIDWLESIRDRAMKAQKKQKGAG